MCMDGHKYASIFKTHNRPSRPHCPGTSKLGTKQEQIENIQEINFNGKNIPLKSERLRMIFKKVENH